MTVARRPWSARTAMIAKVKIGQKQLGWADDVYRAMLAERYNVNSSTSLQEYQLDDLIAHMKSCGFRPFKPSKTNDRCRQAESDLARKVRALWVSLYHLGEVRDPTEEALLKFAQRITKLGTADRVGIQALQWLTDKQAWQVIEALKAWALRAGVEWNHSNGPRAAILNAQWHRLENLREDRTRVGEFNRFISDATGQMCLTHCSSEDLDLLIKALGVQLRGLQIPR